MNKKEFLPFEEAKECVIKLGFSSIKKWREYCKNGLRPQNIPAAPWYSYKNKGWKGCNDWFGSKRKYYRKHTVNHDYFKVWSHNMAYILGFWFADGNIRQNEQQHLHHFTIWQTARRKYILEEILAKMNSDYPVLKNRKTVYYFTIQSKPICEDIKFLGGKSNKSLDVLFPSVPREFLPDFIRGYFDGDGCICRYKKKNTLCNIYSISFTSGSKLFLEGLLKVLKENIGGFKGAIYKKNGKKEVVKGVLWRQRIAYDLKGGINAARKLKAYIYNSSDLKLIEKYNKFKDIGEITCGNKDHTIR